MSQQSNGEIDAMPAAIPLALAFTLRTFGADYGFHGSIM